MKKQKRLFITALIILALSSGCGKTQPVSETETTSEIENTIIKETEESTIETETEIASETETQSIEAETEPIATEEETATILLESETATVEEMAISEMDAMMYAKANVNIRASYSKDSEKIGALGQGERVHVTGVTEDEQWFRVEDKTVGGEGFISAAYLSSDKPVEESVEESAPAPAETQAPPAETQQPAPAETQQSAPVVNPGDEDLPSLEELTGKPSTSDYDLNSIPIEDDGLTAEERAEEWEHDPGFGGILHAG